MHLMHRISPWGGGGVAPLELTETLSNFSIEFAEFYKNYLFSKIRKIVSFG